MLLGFCFWHLLLHKHLKFLCHQGHQSLLYVLFLFFYAWKCFSYSETDIYLEWHTKHGFTIVAIFSGSLWEGLARWAGCYKKGGREVMGAEEEMLTRLLLLVMLWRLLLFLLTTSREAWWEEGRKISALWAVALWEDWEDGQHLSPLWPLSAKPLGRHPSQGVWGVCWPFCLLLIRLEMGGVPGREKVKGCTEHTGASWIGCFVRGSHPSVSPTHLHLPIFFPFLSWKSKHTLRCLIHREGYSTHVSFHVTEGQSFKNGM